MVASSTELAGPNFQCVRLKGWPCLLSDFFFSPLSVSSARTLTHQRGPGRNVSPTPVEAALQHLYLLHCFGPFHWFRRESRPVAGQQALEEQVPVAAHLAAERPREMFPTEEPSLAAGQPVQLRDWTKDPPCSADWTVVQQPLLRADTQEPLRVLVAPVPRAPRQCLQTDGGSHRRVFVGGGEDQGRRAEKVGWLWALPWGMYDAPLPQFMPSPVHLALYAAFRLAHESRLKPCHRPPIWGSLS